MESVQERMKKLRKIMGMTQEKFAASIGIKRNTLAAYESGRNEPSGPTISAVCMRFSVNETWLRDGTGEMFLPDADNTQDHVGDLIRKCDLDDEVRPLIEVLVNMDATERRIVMGVLRRVLEGYDAIRGERSSMEEAYEKSFPEQSKRGSRSSDTAAPGGEREEKPA